MSTTSVLSVRHALQRALWLALAASPALGCGAVVNPQGDGAVDGDSSQNIQGCRHWDGTIIPVGQSRGTGCGSCFCPSAGAAPQCSGCPRPVCALPDGRTINGGESAMVECNSCFCSLTGELSCTERACVDVVESDAISPEGGACTPVVTSQAGCEARVYYPCGAPGGPIDNMLDNARCPTLCAPAAGMPNISPSICHSQSFIGGGQPGPNVVYCGACGVGRLTDGVHAAAVECNDGSVGQWLAQSAWYEAVAANAFDRLACELEACGAPEALVTRARLSAIEEREHHQVFRALAAEERAPVAEVRAGDQPLRTLEQIALENAGEGCVRETLGALVMQWQGMHAKSASLRQAFASIAEQEASHAQWSWELDAWARSVLTDEQIARMDAARTDAIGMLERELSAQPIAQSVQIHTGMPDPCAVAVMMAELRATVWA